MQFIRQRPSCPGANHRQRRRHKENKPLPQRLLQQAPFRLPYLSQSLAHTPRTNDGDYRTSHSLAVAICREEDGPSEPREEDDGCGNVQPQRPRP
jgi:hypothetical protein